MRERQYVFFDPGWTLEDESQAQLDRAEKAAALSCGMGLPTTAARILALQEEGAALQVASAFAHSLSRLEMDQAQAATVLRQATWDKRPGRLQVRVVGEANVVPARKALAGGHGSNPPMITV